MFLRDLLRGLDYELLLGDINEKINTVCYDSRFVKSSSIFVAIKGFKVDGHIFIPTAISNGAKVIIVEEVPIKLIQGITYIKTDNTRLALSKIASNYYDNPSHKLKVIGITGTNGKTSTSLILKNILSHWGKKVGVIGTIGVYIGEEKREAHHTTPESLELQGILHEMLENGVEYVIMEVSSHSLQLDRVANTRFEHVIFTNLTQDHLDFHGDMQSYFNEKKKLFFMYEGTGAINTDDEYGRVLYSELNKDGKPCKIYGLHGNKDVYAKDILYSIVGVQFTLVTSKCEENIYCPIPGEFSVYNILSAITISLEEGIDIEDLKDSLSNMPIISGRIERLNINAPYEVIIDFAHTPDGLENVLKTIRDQVKGRLITVFGCGGDRDKGKRSIMGKIAGELSEFCVITTDNPRSEDPQCIIDDIVIGINTTKCEYITIVDRYKAIAYALNIAQEKDVVLLAGKGHETYQVLHDKTIPFDEKTIVKEILEK
ncbi:UDP-N-acetylmuramoyl-L-alanyl-D-glutamate--2,6-diaminopimelate ligase [Alkalibaculum sp. M08DMB]|uniref:UDP-N-acetylmuramoyl-L-alanyl-D-glutamate--2,6-diaminopimelate ligase n=1 Tax=Alkalibaculum sporogenes TaxID=2655001 RepID=A0A6A7K6W8_9FIRM|nr:UDP-N-acetylmuramoyl-L-alanyl-D-glutamate--2,6-diaminopimelate ligase [Alkalibaculum sporogenes]MPW25176.1 UDP-N-acetylmuramoyl-L-alanyl-D-glutamate--2,6-diaminopimelate ligase [Alkalibaculum sporogenes]